MRIIKLTILAVIAVIGITATPVFAFSTTWANNPTLCLPAGTQDMYNGQNCYPNANCGLNGATLQCSNPASIANPPAVNQLSSTIYSGSLAGGYIINCLAAADGANPYCDNSGNFWCNSDGTCLNTNHRQTQCNANTWANGGSAYTCSNSCISNYYDCNGGVDCERQNGSACTFLPGIQGTYQCSANAAGSCYSAISGGGSRYECLCIPNKQYFETGTQANYSTTDPLLWGRQYGAGNLITMGNSSSADIFSVGNTGLITTTNSTVNSMRIGFNDGVATVGIFSVNMDPNGSISGTRGSLAMDYVNGRLYINTNGSTGWSQIYNASNIPSYTFSTGLSNNAGTITANISTGLAGGQTIIGGTQAGDDLIIESSSNVSKGDILLNPNGGNVGIGTSAPSETLEVKGNVKITENPGIEAESYSLIEADYARDEHTAVWTGTKMIVWGGQRGMYNVNNDGNIYDPVNNNWTLVTQNNAPSARYGHSAVWTGSKMIVWGGFDGTSYFNTGGIYDPLTDTWTATSLTNAPTARTDHSAIWTGSAMVVFGGYDGTNYLNSYYAFDPSTNTWTPYTTVVNTPTIRANHTAVWTGTEMIIWGGADSLYGRLDDGARLNPSTNVWTTVSLTSAPSERYQHTAVWTGTEMIVWGGYTTSGLATGARYNPSSNTWITMSTGPNARGYHTAVWTGSVMVIFGGYGSNNYFRDIGRYDPSGDTWSVATISGHPFPRATHTAVWTGTDMIVWGGYGDAGYANDGGRFNVGSLSWVPMAPVTNNFYLSGRGLNSAVWTGSEMIVFGGAADGAYASVNGKYNPVSDTWTQISSSGAPSTRVAHSAIWTGSRMIVWGGSYYDGSSTIYYNNGAIYDPATDTWSAMSTVGAPAPRAYHGAVWTGSKMVVWGGNNGSGMNTGGVYDPATDTWTATSLTNAPTARSHHIQLWTGTRMIVYSGYQNDGGIYDPVSNTWTYINMTGNPLLITGQGVWTGSRMLVYGSPGGGTEAGGIFNPDTNSWSAMNLTGAPGQRSSAAAVWTGSKMIIYGGWYIDFKDDGAIYDPLTDSWSSFILSGKLLARESLDNSAVWTGSQMILWGGHYWVSNPNDGFVYTPEDNQGHLMVEGNGIFGGSIDAAAVTAGGFYTRSGADVAEQYLVNDLSIEAGDVVGYDLKSSNINIVKTDNVYADNVIGVISSDPGVILSDIKDIPSNIDTAKIRPLALAGRVPVKVTNENGNIKKGDYLVPASKPGFAMKMCGPNYCRSGNVIGRALEDFNYSGDSLQVTLNIDQALNNFDEKLDIIESDIEVDEEVKDIAQEVVDLASDIVKPMENKLGEGRIMMLVGLGYMLSPESENYLNMRTGDMTTTTNNSEDIAAIFRSINIESNYLSTVDLQVTGMLKANKVSTSLISPVESGSLELRLGDDSGLSRFLITNSKGDYLFGVNSKGILEFGNKNPSRGQSVIPEGSREFRVETEGVNNDSIILLTLISDLEDAPSISLASQGDGYFTVKLSSRASEELTFNWWFSN